MRNDAINPNGLVGRECVHLQQLRFRKQGGQHVVDFVAFRGSHGCFGSRGRLAPHKLDAMNTPRGRALAQLTSVIEEYRQHADIARLLEALQAMAEATPTDELFDAADAHAAIPEVLGPLMEVVVAREPQHARALVRLASAYWLSGRGPETVGELASRAIAADPSHRGAWHLWALTETEPRSRMTRWLQVTERFPDDDLARANLADNAATVGTAEDDPVALKLAIDTFGALRRTAPHPAQRDALDKAIDALRNRR